MYNVKAKKGNVDLSMFNLDDLIQSANEEALSISQHNSRVLGLFKDLVRDYQTKLNSHMSSLGIGCFENTNSHICQDYVSKSGGRYLSILKMGHGRATIWASFTSGTPVGERVSADFVGKVITFKGWTEKSLREEFNLESVGGVLEKGEQVIKFFLIERGVEDFRQREELIKQTLKY